MSSDIQSIKQPYETRWRQEIQPLTSDQKSQLQSILSQYDPAQLTADDAKSIFKSLRDAGIRPSQEVNDLMSAAGFDTEQMAKLAKPQGHNGHHGHHGVKPREGQNPSSEIDTSALQTMQSILDQYDLTNLSAEQKTSLVKQLNEAGLLKPGTQIDLKA